MTMFLKWCKKTQTTVPSHVTRTFLETYQRHLFDYRKRDGNPLAVASQHARLAPLKVWFKWLNRRDYISQDPAEELELPRVSYKLPSVLNKEEAEIVLHQPKLETNLGIRDRAILEILYSTGMRRMEILKLRLFDVDQKHGLVAIREGKGKRDRIVPVGGCTTVFRLSRYLTEVRPTLVGHCDDSVVFLTTSGESFSPNHLSWLTRFYVRSAKQARRVHATFSAIQWPPSCLRVAPIFGTSRRCWAMCGSTPRKSTHMSRSECLSKFMQRRTQPHD